MPRVLEEVTEEMDVTSTGWEARVGGLVAIVLGFRSFDGYRRIAWLRLKGLFTDASVV